MCADALIISPFSAEQFLYNQFVSSYPTQECALSWLSGLKLCRQLFGILTDAVCFYLAGGNFNVRFLLRFFPLIKL